MWGCKHKTSTMTTVWVVRKDTEAKPFGVFTSEEKAAAAAGGRFFHTTQMQLDDTNEYVIRHSLSGKELAVYSTEALALAALKAMTVSPRPK